MTTPSIHIVGAGPAGLAAALYLARAGFEPVVFEQADHVGASFDGTLQVLENWSTEEDALEVLAAVGLAPTFRCDPITSTSFYGPERKPHVLHATRPLGYVVERGARSEALDHSLLEQARAAGAEVRFGERVERSDASRVIVATGARTAEAHAEQVIFQTSHPDASVGFLDDTLAPGGHVSLLIRDGDATLTAWCFDRARGGGETFASDAFAVVREELGLEVRAPRRGRGIVNFSMAPPWTRNGRFYLVGERADQDALWGFGLRYALLSGILAARAVAMGEDYDVLCRRYIVPSQEVSLANRTIMRQLDSRGYDWALAAGHRLLDDLTGGRTLQQGRLPVAVSTTDLYSGGRHVLRRGSAAEAVYASAALAGILPPLHRDGRLLADGVYADIALIDVARAFGHPVVIAVDPSEALVSTDIHHGYQALMRAAEICQLRHAAARFAEADLVLRPRFDRVIDTLDFDARRECLAAGLRVVRQHRGALRRQLHAPPPETEGNVHAAEQACSAELHPTDTEVHHGVAS